MQLLGSTSEERFVTSQGCTTAPVQTSLHTKNHWGLGCWAWSSVTHSSPLLKRALDWWWSSKVMVRQSFGLSVVFAGFAFVTRKLSVFPWETTQTANVTASISGILRTEVMVKHYPGFPPHLVTLFSPPLLAGDMNLMIPATQRPNDKQHLPSRNKSAWNQTIDSGFSATPFNVVTLGTALPVQTKLNRHIWPNWALCLHSSHPLLSCFQITVPVGGKPEVFNKYYYFISFC